MGVMRWRRLASRTALGLSLVFLAVPATVQDKLDTVPVPTTPGANGFTITGVGDLIYLRPMLATIEARSPPAPPAARCGRDLRELRDQRRHVAGCAAETRLYPIDLGVELQGAIKGAPMLASPSRAQTILERLQRLSKPFGTQIAINKGIGVIRLGN